MSKETPWRCMHCGTVFRDEASALACAAQYEEGVRELEASLKLQQDANMRGVKLWQAAHPGNELVWPDQAKMVAWMLETITSLESRLARVEAAARELVTRLAVIHADPAYKAVWASYMLHAGSYKGPNYVREMEALRTALSEQKDDRGLDQAWHQVSGKQPPPHGRYEAYQAGRGDFTATVCYGMHHPWWVPDGKEPIDMLPSDMWRVASQEPPR